MVNVTQDNAEALTAEIRPFQFRRLFVEGREGLFAQPGLNAKKAWDRLTPEQQARVEQLEIAVSDYRTLETQEEERQKAVAGRRRRLEQSGCRLIDRAFDACVLGQLEETGAMATLRRWWAERVKPWFVLSGATGSGKSIAAADKVADTGGLWVRADQVVRLYWANFGDQYEQQQALRDTHLLVIDDLGCELDASRMLPALLDLLDSRKSARSHSTVVTTNLNKKAFSERYANERLSSRMVESVLWEGIADGDMRKAKRC